MGRNLLAYSDERVAMFNSQGHVIFEQPLEGSGHSTVEMFQNESQIFSCFVRGDTVYVYKQYLQVGSFNLGDQVSSNDFSADFSPMFEPLELIHNMDDGRLLLVAKTAVNADNASSMVSVFNIDYENLKSELVGT